jgi:hypothetical protein
MFVGSDRLTASVSNRPQSVAGQLSPPGKEFFLIVLEERQLNGLSAGTKEPVGVRRSTKIASPIRNGTNGVAAIGTRPTDR